MEQVPTNLKHFMHDVEEKSRDDSLSIQFKETFLHTNTRCRLHGEIDYTCILLQDIDQQAKLPCCCSKVQSSKDSTTDPQYCDEWQPFNTSLLEASESKEDFVQTKDERALDVLKIRRSISTDNLTTYETRPSKLIRKFSSYKQLGSPEHFIDNYNRAKVTELNDEEDEVVDEINEPVFVDIPTLVAVLIKPDDSLQESSTQIEEICSDEVQENSIDADFIRDSNEDFHILNKVDDVDLDDCGNFASVRSASDNSEIGELDQTLSECSAPSSVTVEKAKLRGKFNKQNSIDLPSSNLNVSRKFGSIEGISKCKESTSGLQRSHTNLEKHPVLSDRVKKLNNIREIDDLKTSIKPENIWKAIGKTGGSKNHQRKSSNDSDKSLRDFNSGKAYNISRKPSLESLKRKTSKDSSSSSSKDEQILISNLTRDKLLRRKGSLESPESGAVRHTTIQRVKRAEIVAAVTERLYSSRKHTEEINNMATNNASGMRSPPEGTDVKAPAISGFAARSKLQEISRKMLLKRRRINVETQTEGASTLRFKDTASLTDEPKIVLRDAAVLTDEHANCNTVMADHRLPVLRVKDVATLTDRPRTKILRCRDVESSTNDLDFDDYELHSPRNDSGILSDDTQNYVESNLSEVFEFYREGDRRTLHADSSTNTFLSSPGRDSAVQTVTRQEVAGQQKNAGWNKCCGLAHEANQHCAVASCPEKNVISISLPDTISITIESTNNLESRIAVIDGSESTEEKPKFVFSDKESQTDERVSNEVKGSFLKDFSVRSTAIQADGKVFRIENIFQDPRSKSCSDEAFDLRMQTAMKRSVTFRNSLGTSSVMETKESDGVKTELEGIHDLHTEKQLIPKGDLTHAFIARRQRYSLSFEKSINKLVHHDLWKNWILSRSVILPEFSKCDTETIDITSSVRDTNTELVDNLNLSSANNEHTPVDEILNETINASSNKFGDSKDSKKSRYVSKSLDYDHNFSDDSLDYDEDSIARKSTEDVKTVDSGDCKDYENLCPPDVVAHTKKEASKSANHVNSTNVQSLENSNYEDTEMEFSKERTTEASNKSLGLHDYKSLILGTTLYVADRNSEQNMNTETSSLTDSDGKISFSSSSGRKEWNDDATNYESSASKPNSEVTLKSIIKKMKRKKTTTEPIKNEKVLSAVNQDTENSEKLLNNKKVEFSDKRLEEFYSESDSVVSDEDVSSCVTLRRDILEEYLSEATIFMRNMNSLNEYMNVTNVLERYGKRRRRRKNQQGNGISLDKNYIIFRGRKVSLKDDTDKYLRPYKDEDVTVESYEKYLKGIERLEACIDKIGRHNQVLRDRYDLDVESAGAKLNLASSSTDSEDKATCPLHEDRSSSCRTSLPSLSSARINIARQSSVNERDKRTAVEIDEYDLDNKNNNVTSKDNLENRIFDQLMDAADSRWSLSTPRHKRLWRMSDFRVRSPTTYSKLRETFRQDARRILNFDQVPTAEDYLDEIRGIGSSPQDFSKIGLFKSTGEVESDTDSIECKIDTETSLNCVKLSEKDDGALKIKVSSEPMIFETKEDYSDYLIDSTNSTKADQIFYAEDEIARRNIGLKDSLRIDSVNHRSFQGSLSIELKYPGSPRAKFLELLKERRRIVESSRGTSAAF